MEKVKALLEAKVAAKLEAVLAATLDEVLDRALDKALNALLGVEVEPSAPAKAEPTRAEPTRAEPAKTEPEPKAEPKARKRRSVPETRVKALALQIFPHERKPLEEIETILSRRFNSLERVRPGLGGVYLEHVERTLERGPSDAVRLYKMGRIDLEKLLTE